MSVENFLSFRKMMIRRNTELNEEALKVMLEKEKQALQAKQREIEQEAARKAAEEEARRIEKVQKQEVERIIGIGKPNTVIKIDPEFYRIEQ